MQFKSVKVILFTIMVLFIFSRVSRADDISALIEQGRKAYAGGNYDQALSLFQQVVIKIQSKHSQSFESFLPAAPKGWKAAEVQNSAWSGASGEEAQQMWNLSKQYTRQADEVNLTISLTNWPTMVEGVQQSLQMYKNPQMKAMMDMDQENKITLEEKAGWTIMIQTSKGEGTSQVNAVSGKMLLSISDAPDEKTARQFLSLLDLAGLGQAAAAK